MEYLFNIVSLFLNFGTVIADHGTLIRFLDRHTRGKNGRCKFEVNSSFSFSSKLQRGHRGPQSPSSLVPYTYVCTVHVTFMHTKTLYKECSMVALTQVHTHTHTRSVPEQAAPAPGPSCCFPCRQPATEDASHFLCGDIRPFMGSLGRRASCSHVD